MSRQVISSWKVIVTVANREFHIPVDEELDLVDDVAVELFLEEFFTNEPSLDFTVNGVVYEEDEKGSFLVAEDEDGNDVVEVSVTYDDDHETANIDVFLKVARTQPITVWTGR